MKAIEPQQLHGFLWSGMCMVSDRCHAESKKYNYDHHCCNKHVGIIIVSMFLTDTLSLGSVRPNTFNVIFRKCKPNTLGFRQICGSIFHETAHVCTDVLYSQSPVSSDSSQLKHKCEQVHLEAGALLISAVRTSPCFCSSLLLLVIGNCYKKIQKLDQCISFAPFF